MSTVSVNRELYAALFGKTRRAILSLLFGHADEAFYLRQIVRLTGSGLGAVQRELKTLTAAGILKREAKGLHVYYQANAACLAFAELKSLLSRDIPSSASELPGNTSGRVERNIRVPRKKLAEFCKRNHITKLAFFGSVLRKDFRPDSDIDVLVEFEPGHVPGFAFFGMQEELSEILGSKVDLHTPASLSQYFRDQVVKEAQVRYAAS